MQKYVLVKETKKWNKDIVFMDNGDWRSSLKMSLPSLLKMSFFAGVFHTFYLWKLATWFLCKLLQQISLVIEMWHW